MCFAIYCFAHHHTINIVFEKLTKLPSLRYIKAFEDEIDIFFKSKIK